MKAPDRPGRLLVRPEDLEELPAGASRGVEAIIEERRFFGHDLLDRVRLDGGEVLEVRLLSDAAGAVGDRIRLALKPGGGHLIPE